MVEKFHNLEPEFKKMLTASLIFHASIFFVFTVKTVFFPTDIPEYQPVMRVDLVGLPDKRKDDILPTPTEKKEEFTKPEEKKQNLSKTQDSALNKLKTQKAIEALKNSQKDQKKNDSDVQKKALEKLIKGNQKSEGNSLTGLAKLEFNQYIGTVDSHVKNNWLLPEWMRAQSFQAQVLIRIDSSGNIIEKRFIKKSGNSEFDENVERALEKSNPFPAPPEKLVDHVSNSGIIFAFPE